MNEAQERVLALALAEELSAKRPPDLTLRILLAARNRRLRALPSRVPFLRPRVLVAAALILVAAVGGAFWVLRPGAPPVSSTAKLRVVGAGGAERWDERFAAGEWVETAGEEGAVLTFPSGTDVSLGSRTLLKLVRTGREPAVDLLFGAVEAHGALEIGSALGPVVVGAGAVARVEVAGDPWLAAEAFPARARQWIAGGAPPAPAVLVGVSSGTATAAGLAATAGESLDLSPDAAPARGRLPPPATRREIDALLAAVRVGQADLEGTGPDVFLEMKKAEQAGWTLLDRLAADPPLWNYSFPRLALLPRDGERPDVRDRLLRLLAYEPGHRGDALLSEALRAGPDAFDPDTILVLAEKGLAAAIDRLAASVAGADAPELRVSPAAFFAMRGDARGKDVLETYAASTEFRGARPLDWLAAVAGLAAIDGAGRWREAMGRLAADLAPRLDAGQLEYVRWLALAAGYFRPAAVLKVPVSLARLGYAVESYQESRKDEVRTPEQVRALLRSLSD